MIFVYLIVIHSVLFEHVHVYNKAKVQKVTSLKEEFAVFLTKWSFGHEAFTPVLKSARQTGCHFGLY